MLKIQELEEKLIEKSLWLLDHMDEDEAAAESAKSIIPWTLQLVTFTHSASCYWPTHEDSRQ